MYSFFNGDINIISGSNLQKLIRDVDSDSDNIGLLPSVVSASDLNAILRPGLNIKSLKLHGVIGILRPERFYESKLSISEDTLKSMHGINILEYGLGFQYFLESRFSIRFDCTTNNFLQNLEHLVSMDESYMGYKFIGSLIYHPFI